MLSAVGSAGLPDDVSVAAPVRTCTGGHSKLGGSDGAPGAADALAFEPLELNHAGIEGMEGMEGIEGSAEQPPSSGTARANAVVKPRRGKWNSDKPTHAPHDKIHPGLGPEWLTP